MPMPDGAAVVFCRTLKHAVDDWRAFRLIPFTPLTLVVTLLLVTVIAMFGLLFASGVLTLIPSNNPLLTTVLPEMTTFDTVPAPLKKASIVWLTLPVKGWLTVLFAILPFNAPAVVSEVPLPMKIELPVCPVNVLLETLQVALALPSFEHKTPSLLLVNVLTLDAPRIFSER